VPDPQPQTVVLLHGFGGTRRAWDGVAGLLADKRYRPQAIDLPGHGSQADAPRPITFAGCVEHVLSRAPERFALCGYSMGGRVALHVALAAPRRVLRLTLVASSPGIEDDAERAARRAADARLAEDLERRPYEELIERWRSQPLFADEPPQAGELARADQRRNDPLALAAVLRGIGTGEMQPLWSRLAQLTMPVAILVGERDEKFKALGRRMAELLPRAELAVVPGGHGLPLENPAAVAAALLGADHQL
jgi:2-succinyl-6-hydroxy-2,4-cyclohexadiene-1-carboxylate synthase